MTTVDFDFICNLIRHESAIVLERGKEYLVETRLQSLARRENFPSLDALVQRLRTPPANGLQRKVIDAMTTNETSFFRDIHPFEALKTTILPDLINRRSADRQLSFWCGAASTGQEPFSVMMLLAEHFPGLLNWNLKFLATDLCGDVLARAREGRFNQLEVNRGLPASHLVKYFTRSKSEWQFRDDLRKRIEFRELNLMKDWPLLPQFDIVFLRNVLIYFDVETKKRILSKMRPLLRPAGYLMLGGSESTFNVDESFERIIIGKAICHRINPHKK